MSGIYDFYTKAKKKLTDTLGGLGEVANQFKNSLSNDAQGIGNNVSNGARSVMDYTQSAPSKLFNNYVKPAETRVSDLMTKSVIPELKQDVYKPIQNKVVSPIIDYSKRANNFVQNTADKIGSPGAMFGSTIKETYDQIKPSQNQRYDSNVPGWMKKGSDFAYSTAKAMQKTPTADLSKNIKNPVGKFVVENVVNPVVNVPSHLSQAVGDAGEMATTDSVTPSKLLKLGGKAASIGLDAATVIGGGSAAKNVAQTGFKAARPSLPLIIKNGAKQGAKMGAGFGAAYGAAQGVQEGDSIKEQAKNALIESAKQGVAGGVLGGVIGGAAAGTGRGVKSIVNDIEKLKNPKTIINPAKKYVNTGSLISSDGNYPKKIDPNYFQPESLLFKGVRKLEGQPVGLSIKDINAGGKTFPERIAAKNEKARILVNNQIDNQKSGSPKVEPGFVAPDSIKNPKKLPMVPNKIQGIPTDNLGMFLRDKLKNFSGDLERTKRIYDNLKNVHKNNWESELETILKNESVAPKIKSVDLSGLSDEEIKLYKQAIKPLPPLKKGEINLDQLAESQDAARGIEVRKPLPSIDEYVNGPKEKVIAPVAKNQAKLPSIEEYVNGKSESPTNIKTAKDVIESPQFNKYQKEVYDRKVDTSNAVKELLGGPTELLRIGYKKSEITGKGSNEINNIIKLSKLGYPKNEIQKLDPLSERASRVIDNGVPWQTLKSYYEKKHALDTNFLDGIDPATLKDINPLMAGGRDVYRNFEAVFGKNYPKLKTQLLDPFDEAKGNMFKEQELLTNEIYDNVVKKLGIEKGSDVDKAVVAFGEGKITLEKLQEDFPKNWQNIVKADEWFKNKYPQLLSDLNAVREANFPTHPLYPETTKIIPQRKDYYRHGKETDGLAGIKNLFEGPASIDPALAATSDVTNPKTKWASFAQRRKGDANDFGAVQGYLDYIKNHSYVKHIDPFIQRFQGVSEDLPKEIQPVKGLSEELTNKLDPIKQIAESTDPLKIKEILMSKGVSDPQSNWMSENLSKITDPEKVRTFIKNKLEKNKNTSINKFESASLGQKGENQENNFLVFVKNFSRDLAGKTNPIDRPFQENLFGRKALNIVNALNSRFKANAVLGNLSSSIAQVFNVPQGFASAGARNSAKGLGRSLAGIFKENEPLKQSSFISERFFDGYNKFDTGILNNTKKFAVWVTGIGDEMGTKFIWNSHYEKALKEGIANPVKYADDWTRKMVAGRGIGEVPIAQKSKIVQLIAPFQLEVANQWYALRDLAQNDPRKLVMAKKLLEFSVASFLMNRVAKEIRGSDVSFDPMNAMIEAYKEFSNEDKASVGLAKAGGRIAGEVASNIPLGAAAASTILSENNRRKYVGDADPSRFGTGGGLLLGSGLVSGDILTKEGWKKTGGDLASKLALPYGGKQIQKTLQGANALINGYSENSAGNVMTPVDRNIPNVMKGVMFGKNALGEMTNYFDNNQTPLSKEQTEKFKIGGNGYFDSVMASRTADNEKTQLKKLSESGKTSAGPGDIGDGIHRLADGNYYVPGLLADTKTFKTEKLARFAIDKEDFMNSEDKTREHDGNFWFKDANGEFKTKTLSARQKDLAKASSNLEMDRAKGKGDIKAWAAAADKKIAAIDTYMKTLNPAVDQDEIDSLTLEKENLMDTAEKYAEQGGFKKGKKLEEKYRYNLVDADMLRIKNLIEGTAPKKPVVVKRPLQLIRRPLPVVHRTTRR